MVSNPDVSITTVPCGLFPTYGENLGLRLSCPGRQWGSALVQRCNDARCVLSTEVKAKKDAQGGRTVYSLPTFCALVCFRHLVSSRRVRQNKSPWKCSWGLPSTFPDSSGTFCSLCGPLPASLLTAGRPGSLAFRGAAPGGVCVTQGSSGRGPHSETTVTQQDLSPPPAARAVCSGACSQRPKLGAWRTKPFPPAVPGQR